MIAWQAATAASPAARRHSALALEYGRSRDALDADLLRGCDPGADSATTPGQYLQQLANTLRILDSPDTSFMLGQLLLPGHDGAASHALVQAPNLRALLLTLCQFHARPRGSLSPRQTSAAQRSKPQVRPSVHQGGVLPGNPRARLRSRLARSVKA